MPRSDDHVKGILCVWAFDHAAPFISFHSFFHLYRLPGSVEQPSSNNLLDLLHRNNTLLFIYYTRARSHASILRFQPA